MDIEQNQSERLLCLISGFQFLQCGQTVGDSDRLQSTTSQCLFQNSAVRGVVVNNQNPAAMQLMYRGIKTTGWGFFNSEPRREVKATALSQFTFNPNPSTHHADNVRRNGQ